jgi:hypothetical protein
MTDHHRHDPLAGSEFDDFKAGYIEAIEFTERDNLGAAELASETIDCIDAECRAFWYRQRHYIAAAMEAGNTDMTTRDAGHDFWLTRNGHGVGFWDGDWLEPWASILDDEALDAFGAISLYVGDDGLVYQAEA